MAIRISVVSYLNSRPFVKGLEQLATTGQFFVERDIPSVCALKLQDDRADIGLIPVAMIPMLQHSQIITSFCISANGKVDSVLLVSQVPLKDIKNIVLDIESRTSVLLAKILADEYWNIQPTWTPETPLDSFSDPDTIQSAVIIGDRALKYSSRYTYCYDLAEEWKKHTGLPFVFAAWVSNKPIEEEYISQLETAFNNSLSNLDELMKELQNEYPETDVKTYLQERIKYKMGSEEKKGLTLFLEKKKKIESADSGPVITVHIK